MKISKQQLKDMGACDDGLARFIKQTNDTEAPVEIISLIGGENTYKNLLWLAAKMGRIDQVVKFACNCALINVEMIKPYCTVKKYKTVIELLKDPDSFCTEADAQHTTEALEKSCIQGDATATATTSAAYAVVSAAHAVGYARRVEALDTPPGRIPRRELSWVTAACIVAGGTPLALLTVGAIRAGIPAATTSLIFTGGLVYIGGLLLAAAYGFGVPAYGRLSARVEGRIREVAVVKAVRAAADAATYAYDAGATADQLDNLMKEVFN